MVETLKYIIATFKREVIHHSETDMLLAGMVHRDFLLELRCIKILGWRMLPSARAKTKDCCIVVTIRYF